MSHTSFATTTRGLNRDLLPMRLYENASGVTPDEIAHVPQEIEDA
ncbi:MAG TPA: hypothetical protein VFR47_07660 [Anaerolineales bacterium]|nr:hypothetical protein [Anaerolineales bacterium]